MGLVGGIGEKMLMKMGWSEGTGLGAKRDGIVAPVVARKRLENKGIGAERPQFINCWWDKMMEDAYGKSEDGIDIGKAFEYNGGIRCKAHGTGKLERLQAHEMTALQASDIEVREEKRKKSVKSEVVRDALECVEGSSGDNRVGFANSHKKRKKESKKKDKYLHTARRDAGNEKLKTSDGPGDSSGQESENIDSLHVQVINSEVRRQGDKCGWKEQKATKQSKLEAISSKGIRKRRKKKKTRERMSGKGKKSKEPK